MYDNDNVDLPTLNPWVLTTPPPAQRFVFVRNPYYHRIDEKGQQLPYIDDVIFTVAAANLVPAKAGLGEADLQPRYLNMRDYTFLQKSAKSSGVEVRLWESGSGSQLALYPNLNAKRRGMAQADARRALPPRAVAGDRPRRAERGRLYRPGQALEQHDHGALGAVQARVRDQVGELRSQARQQAARRDRPHQARRRTASACCPTAGRRPSWSSMPSEETEDADALPADRRLLEEDRHQDAVQAADRARTSACAPSPARRS